LFSLLGNGFDFVGIIGCQGDHWFKQLFAGDELGVGDGLINFAVIALEDCFNIWVLNGISWPHSSLAADIAIGSIIQQQDFGTQRIIKLACIVKRCQTFVILKIGIKLIILCKLFIFFLLC
jgi:hypothetical protein